MEWTSWRSTWCSLRMGEHEKLHEHVMFRRSDSSVPLAGLCALLERLGFDERIKGGHHIFTMRGVEEILNLQPKGDKGRPHQVKQVRSVILKYNLTLED